MRDLMTAIICIMLGFGVYIYYSDISVFGDSKSAGEIQLKPKNPVKEDALGGTKFTLTNQYGETVTERSYRNSMNLVFFGFSHCPDICPTALAVMTEAYVQLGQNADEIKPIFITIDPENDTAEVLQEFLLDYNKDIVGLTGSKEELEKVARSYKTYASKNPEGQITHSDLIYLMDKDGNYITHFNRENTPEDIVKAVKKHLKD